MRRSLLTLSLIFLALILLPEADRYRTAQAAEGEFNRCTGAVTQEYQIVIECNPGFNTERQTIAVYSADKLNLGADWRSQLNYTNATWVFYNAQNPKASLIIVFSRVNQELTAQLFDDQNNDGEVSAVLATNKQPQVTEGSGRPTVTVKVKDSWWLPNGAVNYNFDLTADGPVVGMIDTAAVYLRYLKTDGKTDLAVHVRDTNGDGRPDYEWRQAYPPLSDTDGYYHTSVMVNPAQNEPTPQNTFFWPLLGSGANDFIRPDYNKAPPPPVNIDFKKAKLNYIVESVASRARPGNYFVYSIRRIEEGKLNNVNFESPFAFYQFSPQGGNFPDLALRVVYWPRGDFNQGLPVQQVDYSWRQTAVNPSNLPNWDYRLSLLGHNAHEGTINFPEFGLNLTPYANLPGWVTKNSWDYASLVAREGGEYLSSEGMYEWATLEGVVTNASGQISGTATKKEQASVSDSTLAQKRYVLGITDTPPTQYYQQIRKNLRGEFRASNGQVRVYLSPVDRKLHLQGAVQGVWNVDDKAEIRYADLDGDGYFDQWTYNQENHKVSSLNISPNYIVYADSNEATLVQAPVKPSLFDALPPASQQEWLGLGEKLGANDFAFAANDFKLMQSQFEGAKLKIQGATLHDFRPIGKDGFRFGLDLKEGFTLEGPDWAGLGKLKPGQYFVTFNQGVWNIEPVKPANVTVKLSASDFTFFEQAKIQIALRNDGLTDLASTTYELLARSPEGKSSSIFTKTLSLPAQEDNKLSVNWAPTSAGDWTFVSQLRQTDGTILKLDQKVFTVQPAPPTGEATVLENSVAQNLWPLIALTLVGFAGLGAILFWRLTNRKQIENARN